MTEARSCKNCKNSFMLEPDDFSFYERIGVPPPTLCPECRMIRRFTWRNERSLYKRTCGLTKKDVISCFSPESGITVYDRDVWWSDEWEPLSYGREYDFNKPFFTQFRELLGGFPMPALFNNRCYASDYLNHCGEEKNAYLVFASWGGENLSYSSKIMTSKDSMDLLAARHLELCYEVINSTKLYRCAFARDSENCSDSYFLYNCRGCTNCFGCTNLRNKSYYIFNEPHSREKYLEKLKGFDLGSFAGVERARERFTALEAGALRRFASIFNAQDATGDNLSNVKGCVACFDIDETQDSKYIVNGGVKLADSYDGYGVGANAELLYEAVDTGADGSRFLFDIFVWGGVNVQYSYACHGSQNLFGCIGVNKKSYCILNKQYSKEEYEKLVPKIIDQMKATPYVDKRGLVHAYGEFFPSELSPFCYNETIAQEYFPLTENQVIDRGYRWRSPDARSYQITKYPGDLPDHIKDAPDSITNEVIGCAHSTDSTPSTSSGQAGSPHASSRPSQSFGGQARQAQCNDQCTTAFRIIPGELQFYRKLNLPLPRLCSNCRHYERLRLRNPVYLWRRSCQCSGAASSNGAYKNTAVHHHGVEQCPNEFETSYAPERSEIVYCESCYNSEVV